MRGSIVHNLDCMIGMREFPDKHFDLAVVDPPYGFNTNSTAILNFRMSEGEKNWNVAPDNNYWNELIRVSKHQIVWGGNYFPQLWVNGCRGFIYWHKGNPVENFADGELAWTSFNKNAKQVDYRYYGNLEGKTSAPEKIHPTQKPVALYTWIYQNYLPQGGTVIDTHLGSGSNRIAADKAGNIDFTGYELDPDYFAAQEKRWRNYKAQLTLF
jgi:site-specific DNA-methyltransferase (adenine-specific)